MEKWELARYLIDAKKSVDTMLYLSLYAEKVSMIDIKGIVNETRRTFYVNACVVLDKCFPKKKKEICKDALIQSVYYERDKNYAHKDENYTEKQYESLGSIADEMKQQLEAIRKLCVSFLPDALTLDYVPFDSKLFRIANGVTKEIEEAALNIKHPGRLHRSDGGENQEGKFTLCFQTLKILRKFRRIKGKNMQLSFRQELLWKKRYNVCRMGAYEQMYSIGLNYGCLLITKNWNKLEKCASLDYWMFWMSLLFPKIEKRNAKF